MRDRHAVLIPGLCALLVVMANAGPRAAEPGDGKTLYLAQCSNCHGVLKADGLDRPPLRPVSASARLAVVLPFGPTLNGVLGREAGTVPGYQYSRAFLSALGGVVWTRATLDRWITDTREWVPGAIMVYRQPDPDIRARIIDYLEHGASEGAVPKGGGQPHGDRRVSLSAIRQVNR